jgi:hypothetical protein
MSEPPRSYTGRRDLIAEKLEPYLRISVMVPKNTRPISETAEELWDNHRDLTHNMLTRFLQPVSTLPFLMSQR